MSKTNFKHLAIAMCAAPLFLSACDGYELVLTDNFPYGNERTAGSGVAYVLAKMMPEKELVLEPPVEETVVIIEEEVEEPLPPPPVVETPMEEVFQKAQAK